MSPAASRIARLSPSSAACAALLDDDGLASSAVPLHIPAPTNASAHPTLIDRDMIATRRTFAAATVAAMNVMLVLLIAPMASAQSGATAPKDTSPPLPDARLFHRSDLYVLGGFGAATIAMFPLDRHLASVIRDEDLVANKDLKRVASTL